MDVQIPSESVFNTCIGTSSTNMVMKLKTPPLPAMIRSSNAAMIGVKTSKVEGIRTYPASVVTSRQVV